MLQHSCINKESDAELGEAIRSMYRWYSSATVCYALISDASWTHEPCGIQDSPPTSANRERYALAYAALSHSRWVTRGWTLQELVAPKHLKFFGKEWNCMGMKESLANALSSITGIDSAALRDKSLNLYSVDVKMSWVRGRRTTRVEDQAYCLMGLFDVNMALLYGEGSKAFQRLQEEIIRTSSDRSIFCWEPRSWEQPGYDLLASCPEQFTGKMKESLGPHIFGAFQLNNAGLELTMGIGESWDKAQDGSFRQATWGLIGCFSSGFHYNYVLPLREISVVRGSSGKSSAFAELADPRPRVFNVIRSSSNPIKPCNASSNMSIHRCLVLRHAMNPERQSEWLVGPERPRQHEPRPCRVVVRMTKQKGNKQLKMLGAAPEADWDSENVFQCRLETQPHYACIVFELLGDDSSTRQQIGLAVRALRTEAGGRSRESIDFTLFRPQDVEGWEEAKHNADLRCGLLPELWSKESSEKCMALCLPGKVKVTALRNSSRFAMDHTHVVWLDIKKEYAKQALEVLHFRGKTTNA